MNLLLTCCASPTFSESLGQRLRATVSQVNDWTSLATEAEEQGLSPLLYAHLRQADIDLPRPIKREIQGLYLRHKHAYQVRLQVLNEVLTAFRAANLQLLLLKGAAVSFLAYPEPYLRPMRDIDMLVRKSEARRAQELLNDLGFEAPLPEGDTLPDKHLAIATRRLEGMKISLEIHHNLFNDYHPAFMELESLSAAPLAFTIDGLEQTAAYTLGYEDMLWHLCQHVAYHANVWEPIRLVWVADIVGFAERFAYQIDWQRIARHYPLILNTLSLFHFITPLSPTLRQQAPIKIGRRPGGMAEEFQGWPRTSVAYQKDKGWRRILYDSFFPSEWWLRLHYGLDSYQSLVWYRWLRHPVHILARLKQLLQERTIKVQQH